MPTLALIYQAALPLLAHRKPIENTTSHQHSFTLSKNYDQQVVDVSLLEVRIDDMERMTEGSLP